MVASNKEKTQSSSTSKGENLSQSATSSKSSKSKVKSITISSTTSTVSSQKNSSQTDGQQSSVIISEVNDLNSGAIDDNTLRTIQTQYVVSQPEKMPSKAKEHYIYGGTQIVEMGTTMGSEMYREKNQSSWNGKFIYEGTPERTYLKSWESKHAMITEPSTSSNTTTTRTTKMNEDIIKIGIGGVSTSVTHDVSSESSKLVGDTLKQQSVITSTGKSTGKDSTDAAAATDLLLESERCIAKKAYVTTDKIDSVDSSSVLNIESQIIGNTSSFGEKMKTTDKNAKTETSDRYSISTIPSRSGKNMQSTSTDNTNTILRTDNISHLSTEQYSSSFSKSSRSEKSSSSNQVIEIVDGKERITSDTFNESGSMQSKSSSEDYRSKVATGSKPEIEYDHKMAEENISFHNDKRDKQPIFEREYRDSHRNIKQSGDNAPIEYSRGRHETTHYDDKTKKYITDVQQRENDQQLDQRTTKKDGNELKFNVETSRLQIDDYSKTPKTNFQTSIDSNNRFITSENVEDNGSTQTTKDFLSSTKKYDSYDNKSTTYTSKVFDSTSNKWKTVDESNISNVNKHSMHKPVQSDHNSSTQKIDSKSVTTSTSSIDKKSTVNRGSTKDLKTISAKRNVNDLKVTKLDSTKSMTETTNKKISQHLYDEKTKSWHEVDEKTIKFKRPSLIRYVSKDNDGKFTTIYKRKLFDKRTGTWKVVDEKIYKNNNFNEHIPEVIEDETNITTTTFTTKVFDNKTNTWRIVDEQTFTDHNTLVPEDIAQEIARDNPDIANITTTTELTKIFDATTNTWKIVNERSHTDFVEKIVETPKERIIIDDIIDITKIKSINDRTERTTDITDITDINTVKNTYNIHETEETILREVTKENDVHDTSTIINKSIDVVDRSVNKLSDDITKTERHTALNEGGPRKQPKPTDEKKPRAKQTAAQNDQCICEICTCGRHRCTHAKTTDDTLITDLTTIETKSAYRKDFIDKNVTNYNTLRTPMVKPVDNLKPEGNIEFVDRKPFQPAEKMIATRPKDNLFPSGEFTDVTTTKTEYTAEAFERTSPVRRNTWTKLEDDLITTTTSQTEFVDYKDTFERNTQKRIDSLVIEGENNFTTTTKTDFPEQEIVYQRPRKRTWTKDDYEKFHHQDHEQTFVRTDEKHTIYDIKHNPEKQPIQPAEKRTPIKHNDNLRPEGTFERPEKSPFKPAERPQQVKPTDNLKMTGEFLRVERTEFTPAERPKQVRPQDNLHPEGEMYTPEKPSFGPAEKRAPIKHDDNLRPEGTFERPEKSPFKPAERPQQVKPTDNLKMTGEFSRVERTEFTPAERPKQVRPQDNLHPEGEMYTPEKPSFGPAEKRASIKHDDNLRPEGTFERPEKSPFKPAERPQQVKPTDNLKMTGEFSRVERTDFTPAERPKQVRPQDNLRPEGDFYSPEKQKFSPSERPKQVKPQDNLKPEGTFDRPEKSPFKTGERPQQVKPADNLKMTGEFTRVEKTEFIRAERPKQIKPKDNLRPEGDFYTPEKQRFSPGDRFDQVKPQDNLKPEGKFQVPEKPVFKPTDRPKQVRPTDNLKQSGAFYSPEKQQYTPAERPKQVKPKDNLHVTGKFEGRRKSNTVITKIDRATIKKHVDQITLNEGKMETDTTSSSTFKKVKPQRNVVEDIVKKQKMRSNITLGDDTTILRTTNQMNYNTVTTQKDQLIERSSDVTDSNRIKDGTIAITTMKVTTILENEKDHTPIKEIIRTGGNTNIYEKVVHKESGSDVINKRNVINQQHHVNEVHQNVVNRRFIVNENDVKNIQQTKSTRVASSKDNVVNTTQNIGTARVTDSKQSSANQQHIVSDKNVDNIDSNKIRSTTSGSIITKDGMTKSDSIVSTTNETTQTKTSHRTGSNQVINRGGNEILITERTMVTSTPITTRQQNYTSDILNVNEARSSGKSLANTSQSEMINNQMNLRQHETTSTRHAKTSSSNATNYSTSNISSVLYESDQSGPMHRSSTSTSEQQKRDYVSQNHGNHSQSNTQQHHHRKNILTSSTDVNNSVFHRKANLSTNSNEALHSNSMSKTAAIQRKSISNLHDQAIYNNASSDRKSFSSLHRQGKESSSYGGSSSTVHSHQQGGNVSHSTSHVTTSNSSSNVKQSLSSDRTQNVVSRDSLSLGVDFYGHSESKAYGNFGHQQHAADRATFNRRSNQSSISIGDGQNHSSSVYRREFAVVHSGPCPAAQLDKKTTFTHTRDTKSHKFYKSSFQ